MQFILLFTLSIYREIIYDIFLVMFIHIKDNKTKWLKQEKILGSG